MRTTTVRVTVSLLLAAALLALFLWNVDLESMGRVLLRAHPGPILLSVALALLSYWLRAVRWQVILAPVQPVRHSSVVITTAVGYTAMTLLPARLGDLIRPILLARRERLPVSASLASILTERIFDLMLVVALYLVFVVWPPAMDQLDAAAEAKLRILGRTGYAMGAGLVVGVLVLIGLFAQQERFVNRLTSPLRALRPAIAEKVARFLGHFLDGLRVIQRPRQLLLTVALSAVMWLTIAFQLKASLAAFSISMPLRATFLVLTLSILGLAIPTPGGVGGFHAAIQLGLVTFFGVALERASAVAVAHHAVCFLPITVVGLLLMPLLGIRLGRISRAAEEAGARPAAASPDPPGGT